MSDKPIDRHRWREGQRRIHFALSNREWRLLSAAGLLTSKGELPLGTLCGLLLTKMEEERQKRVRKWRWIYAGIAAVGTTTYYFYYY